jgi:hypothetical protein
MLLSPSYRFGNAYWTGNGRDSDAGLGHHLQYFKDEWELGIFWNPEVLLKRWCR